MKSINLPKFEEKELSSSIEDYEAQQRHLCFLVTEVFRSVNNLNPHFIWVILRWNFPYDLKKGNALHLQAVKSPWSKFTFIPTNSLLFRQIHFYSDEFTFIPTNSLLFRQIHFYSEELRKTKKKREIKRSISAKEFKKRLKKDGALPCPCVV